MAKRPGSSNTLRIIGGQHGGRKLQFPDARGLRPTSDRIRETLFNWLQGAIRGSRCLDLFAGSGALGFEAQSRGASHVTLIEASAAVARALRENAALLGVQEQVCIQHARALTWLEQYEGAPFDIVFLDPPFADELLQDTVDRLAAAAVLSEEALIYIERDRKQSLPVFPGNWHLQRDKTAGQVAYSLLQSSK